MEILPVNNGGFIIIEAQQIVYCKDAAEVHKELEYVIGSPPIPPTEKKPATEGVRQFDDED